jgi:hypothetical protein
MADFVRFIVAASPSSWQPGSFIAAHQRSQLDANGTLADGDTVATPFVLHRGCPAGMVGLMSISIEPSQCTFMQRHRIANARWLGDRLRRGANVARAGIDFTNVRRRHQGDIPPIATLATPTRWHRRSVCEERNVANAATEPTSGTNQAGVVT